MVVYVSSTLSLLITDEFMQAVIKDEDWKLVFPVTMKEVEVDEFRYF